MTPASVYPKEMPSWVRQDPLRSAECKVYDSLKAQLNQPYVLFYSRPWLGLSRDGREIDGEADFVIGHPEFGILVLEVKGGEIRYDPRNEVWTSTDRYGIVHQIKNPAYQAKGSKYQILGKLRGARTGQHGRIRARHAVIFPDCERTDKDLAADMPLSICAFLEDMPKLGNWVNQRMSVPTLRESGETPLGEEGIEALEGLLSRPLQLHTPLGHILQQEEEQIVLLTDEQYQILDGFDSYQRLAIAGGAGTGKTALAIEKARRSAAAGSNTLLVCYNRPLATYLNRVSGHLSGLNIMTFHELCASAARKSQIVIPPDVPPPVLFGKVLPEALVAAMRKPSAVKFDAVIVDEGQDFQPSWWPALEACLRDQTAGVLFVFYDDRQKLYEWPSTYLKGMPQAPFRLTRNVRNARPIFDEARPYFGNSIIRPAGPDGPPVEHHRVRNCREALDAIIRLLDVLIQDERVSPSSIAVLLAHEGFLRVYPKLPLLGRYKTRKAEDGDDRAVIVDTVRRFKGLEASIVIFVWGGPATCDSEVTYVALTRARGQLHDVVIEP